MCICLKVIGSSSLNKIFYILHQVGLITSECEQIQNEQHDLTLRVNARKCLMSINLIRKEF